jgi:predicted FMN-binding regulatory protein PaiB
MYMPSARDVKDPAKIGEVISSNSFAILFSQDGDSIFASHLSFLYKPELGEKGRLTASVLLDSLGWKIR